MPRLKTLARAARDFVYRIAYRGTGRWCPVCERPARRFAPFGVALRRKEAMCVHCGALERHRFVWVFLKRKTALLAGPRRRVLHIAPERALESRLRRRLGTSYVTADLDDPAADVRMDVTRMQYPDASFDVVYCSHVLEHVPDDRAALREIYRVLAPDGWAVLLVPVTVERTVEDPSITDPKERLRRFGQEDHVRRYGPDFADRLREAGFAVSVVGVGDVADRTQATLMGLTPASGEIFYCTKSSAAPRLGG